MLSILKRELSAYFNSALAWIVIAVFILISGFIFVSLLGIYGEQSLAASSSPFGAQSLNPTDRVMVPVFQWMGYLLLFFLPVLTMRLIAEESRVGMLEMLFTYPLGDWEIVLGKFFGALGVVGVMMALSSSYYLVLSRLIKIEWTLVASGYLGLLLLSCAFVAFGIWASSLTSSQMVSAVITYGGLLASWLVVIAGDNIQTAKDIFGGLSPMDHLVEMARGTISTHHLVYFLAWTCLFLFLTVRTLESRKWSGT
jgi:gliding motility-associated transport system permease protein